MGWARRRRQQQQQLRRRASKEYLSATLKAEETYYNNLQSLAPVDADLQFTKNPVIEDHHEVTKPSASKWYENASPRKTHSHTLGHKRSGLREKLYSVDSLAETEPEDDDDDEDTESEEDSDSGESVFSSRQLVHEANAAPLLLAASVKIEASIQEEDESAIPPAAVASSKKLDTSDEEEEDSDDTDLEEDGYASEDKPSVATVVTMSASEDEAKCELVYINDAISDKLVGSVVDGEDTESEDGDIDEAASTTSFVSAASSSSTSSEEFTKVDLFGQSLNEKKEKEESQHAPFLFPPPYFPGDLDEYESDIYETLLRREKVHHVVTDYFSFQPHVTGVMRAMLIDWLVEVHNHFNLQPDTLYLTVNYIDRFLAKVPVKRENFQLVALTALLIASKFEEVHPVDIEDLVYICERSYTAQQIVQFEKEMLQAFKFNLVVPTCSGFLEYYIDKLSVDLQVSQLASFFSEQTLLDFHLSAKYVPSVIASSSLLLAQCYFEKSKPELSWVLEFEEVTGYYAKDIWCCVRDLSDMLVSLSFDLVAVRTKFRSSRLGRVADIPHLNVSSIVIE